MKSVFLFVSLFTITGVSAQYRIPSERPKLIVGIVVEQMRSDYIYKFWDKFTEGGFKRLVSEGTNCRNANFNYLYTQTCVGHATIATGTSPSYHGIVSGEWYDRLRDKMISCIGDEKEKTAGGSYEAGRFSPRQLLTSTIGDEMRLSSYNRSKVIGISLNPESAILSSGQTANAAYWIDDENGNWVSSTYYMKDLPDWVSNFNDKKIPDVYLSRPWDTQLPISEYESRCWPDNSKYETGFNGRKTFPYNLPEMFKNDKNRKKYSLLKYTPFGNTYTKDFAISEIVNDSLGKDENTDLLMVSFSAGEYIGQNFGSESIEMMDTYIRMDQDLEYLLNFLNQEVGKQNVLVFLTSDHGVAQSPDYLNDRGLSVGYFVQTSSISLLKSYMNALYGKGDWIKGYYAQQIFLNHDLIENAKLNLSDVQQKVAQFMLQFSGVANTITSTTLQTSYFPDGVFSKMQKSFNQKRSGDILINLDPGWVEKNGSVVTHNSAYSYDTHVPLVWYGWKIKRATLLDPVDMTDLAPTISYFLNIPSPNAATGKAIFGLVNP